MGTWLRCIHRALLDASAGTDPDASPLRCSAQAAERIVSAGHIVVQTDDVTRFFRCWMPTRAPKRRRPATRLSGCGHGCPAQLHRQPYRLDGAAGQGHPGQAGVVCESENLRDGIAGDPRASPLPRSVGHLLPSARFPPVTVLVGRGNSGGVTTEAGVVIGLEALCNADWMQPDVGDRFVHLIAHEYVHVQQPGARVDVEQPTLLYQTLLEGGAEYVAELISGQPANAHLQRWTQGRECALERAFVQDSMGTDLSKWLYNGPGDDARRGDLGYWIGYRIAHAYVARAPDRRSAIAELLDVRPDAAALLEASGWRPACGAGGSTETQHAVMPASY
jgi:hypothetical protein